MTEREYLEQRVAAETRLATDSDDDRAAAAHWAMADEYLNRLAAATFANQANVTSSA